MEIELKTEYDWENGLIQMSYMKSKQKYKLIWLHHGGSIRI